MNKPLLAFSLFVVVSASCTPTPTRAPFFTLTPDASLLAPPTETRLPAPPSATALPSATPSQTPAVSTQTLAPKSTAVIRTNPTAMRTWKGGTTLVETQNLSIHYPDVIPAEDAKLHADILEKAYATDLVLFGNERPFSKKISIVWDPASTGGAFAGNPITACGKCPNAFTIPPDMGLFHELVHDFTGTGRTRAARYITLNRAMDEAFANYFAYYFKHEVLKYSAADIAEIDKFRSATLQFLTQQYEAAGTSPYSAPWKPYTAADTYFTGMMFRVVDQCGWGVWPKFFAAAFNSGNPGIPVDKINLYEDMTQPAAKKAFADFVGFLGQACGQDLRPKFKSWRFDLP